MKDIAKFRFLIIFLINCGDNYSACRDGVTTYLGPVLNCQGVPENICVEDRGPGGSPVCRERCRKSKEGPACGNIDRINDGEVTMFATSIVISNDDGSIGHECYCEPHPLAPDYQRED